MGWRPSLVGSVGSPSSIFRAWRTEGNTIDVAVQHTPAEGLTERLTGGHVIVARKGHRPVRQQAASSVSVGPVRRV